MMDMLLEFLAGILVKMLFGIVYGDEGGKTSQSNLLYLFSKSFIFYFYSLIDFTVLYIPSCIRHKF